MRRFSSWAGIMGPLFFVAVFTFEGAVREGYIPGRHFVSELSLGPRGVIQILNFIVGGSSLFIYSRRLAAQFRELKLPLLGPTLIGISGLALFFSGPFVMDPPGTELSQQTWHGIAHNVSGAVFFSLSTVSCFVLWKRFRAMSSWQTLKWPALLTGVVMTAAVLLLKAATYPGATNALTDFTGMIQRAALIPFMLFVTWVAWSLREQE